MNGTGRPPGDALRLDPVRHSWSESDRFVPRAFVRPVQRFMRTSQAGGLVMLAGAVIALIWANSPWHESYNALWETNLSIELGDLLHIDHLDLRDWLNEGLMAIFFFVMALEIKRELVFGRLRDRRAAVVPVVAAAGGMVVPAAIYAVINAGGAGSDGWGIPMATDIAFAVGILALAGARVAPGAKVFLLTLAIVDDIGAIIVIALFYSTDLSLGWLFTSIALIGGVVFMQRIDIRSEVPVVAMAAAAWVAMLESGISPTLTGVFLGLMTPAWSFYAPRQFAPVARGLVDEVADTFADDELSHDELERNHVHMIDLSRLTRETISPMSRHLQNLDPWVAFVIVPLFALANAGVRITGDTASGALSDPVVMGVALGLIVGKTVGVFGATWLAVRSGLGVRPAETDWRQLLGVSMVAGVGFTVALFVAGLAFPAPALEDSAKIGILAGSLVAGVAGFTLLRTSSTDSA